MSRSWDFTIIFIILSSVGLSEWFIILMLMDFAFTYFLNRYIPAFCNFLNSFKHLYYLVGGEGGGRGLLNIFKNLYSSFFLLQ